MLSLYHRLNLTKVLNRPKVPLWERINLERPPKPLCSICKKRTQLNWRICPYCGAILASSKLEPRHCIWVDPSGVVFNIQNRVTMMEVLADSFSKVFSAFRSVSVFLTSEPPVAQEWGENYTHVYILFSEDQPVDYLGIASFKSGTVTNQALVRLDQILNASDQASLNFNQLSNLISNIIAHEIGHTLGLNHSKLAMDVMHDGLDHRIHSLMPPSFHSEQILMMNHAINRHKPDS